MNIYREVYNEHRAMQRSGYPILRLFHKRGRFWRTVLLDENAVWKAMGSKGEMPISAKMDKKSVGELIKSVKVSMPAGLAFTFSGWTIEGNRVAADIESYGELANGKIYNNYYDFLIEFKRDQIAVIKEYMDTLHVKEIFLSE